jgi:hypothetical protein
MSRRVGAFWTGVAAGAAALVAMAAVGLGALLLLGFGIGELPLVVALAVGAPAHVGNGGFALVRFQVELSAVPLGVSLAGAGALAAVALWLMRPRAATPARTGTFVLGAASGFQLLLAPVLWFGHANASTSPGAGALPSAGVLPGTDALPGAGGLPGAGLGSLNGLHADAAATAWHACAWLLIVLALTVMCSRGLPLGSPAERVRLAFRPAVAGLAAVALGATALLTGAAAAIASATNGPKAAGAVLLGGPNAVLAGMTKGLGANWHLNTADLPAALRELPSYLTPEIPQGPLLAAATGVLLLAGFLTAALTTGSGAARILRSGLTLGTVTALAFGLIVAVARVTLGIRLDLGGLAGMHATFGLQASVLRTAALGLAEGAAAGAAGALLVEAIRWLAPLRKVERAEAYR